MVAAEGAGSLESPAMPSAAPFLDPGKSGPGADSGEPVTIELLPDPAAVPDESSVQLTIQRLLDICVATAAALVAFFPGLVIAAIVRSTSTGPVFFVQERVGQHGEVFRLVKFRTMRDGTHLEVRANAEMLAEYQANDFKLPPDDPRITAIGRWLRRTSLDEVPQLINVLKGEMSIVGVRPLLTEELALRTTYDQALYRALRPGMTGLWQVEGRSTVQKEDRLHLDRRYLETWSLWRDAEIILRTPGALFRMSHAH